MNADLQKFLVFLAATFCAVAALGVAFSMPFENFALVFMLFAALAVTAVFAMSKKAVVAAEKASDKVFSWIWTALQWAFIAAILIGALLVSLSILQWMFGSAPWWAVVIIILLIATLGKNAAHRKS